jgi:hypothetical protein
MSRRSFTAGKSLALESSQYVVGQWLKEGIGNCEFAFCDADPGLPDVLLAKGPDFRYRLIAVAQHQRLIRSEFGQIARQIGFGVVNIDSLHDYILNQKVN